MTFWRSAVLALALLFDVLLGDPPNRYHPVAWMGQAITEARSRAPRRGRSGPFLFGAALAAGGAATVATIGKVLASMLVHVPRPLAWIIEAAILKSTFSWRGLHRAATEVQTALAQGNLPAARQLVSWHLVSRDTSQLSASQVAAATIESVAENTSDGIVAPLFYYTLGGLPAALAYRFFNTVDAMLGYHDSEREWLGKAPARLDDLANLVPARLTALFLTLAADITGENAPRALHVWQRDAGKTASPNAGHPMSVMAGALNVELEKVGHYKLGAGQNAARAEDIGRSLRLMNVATLLAAGTFVALPLLVRAYRGSRRR